MTTRFLNLAETHKCNWLSNCCDERKADGTILDADVDGVSGKCGNCGESGIFYDEGVHAPWSDDDQTDFNY